MAIPHHRMNFLTTTKQYYAKWLDVSPSRLDAPGIHAIDSPKRDERQIGFNKRFDLYAFVTEQTTVISYGQRLRAQSHTTERCFEHTENVETVRNALCEYVGVTPQHALKFVFTVLPNNLDTSQARQLSRDDYPDFLHFHQQQYPNANAESWLKPYFNEIADKGCVFGVYTDGRLVSATDAPDVPYLRDRVVEPGIATLPNYRKRGYATIIVGALVKHLLATDKVPLWSCSAANIASRKLAERVGFVKFADVITLSLP